MYQVRRRLKDYKDVADVELAWKVIRYKVASDVKKEIAIWSKKADNYTDQLQIQKATTVLEKFAQLKFEADVFAEFHMAFQVIETEQGAPDASQDETMQD